MELIGFKAHSSRLTDVNRRSFFATVTLCDWTAWVQWWPRPIAGKKMLTAGIRRPIVAKGAA